MFGSKKVSALVATGNPFSYLSLNIQIFRSFGFWPVENTASPFYKITRLVRIVPYLVILLYTVFFVSELIDVYLRWGNVQSVTETLCIAFTIVNMTCKMIHFVVRKSRIEKLIADFRISDFHLTVEGNQCKTVILKDCVDHSRKVTLYGWVMVVTTAIIWGVLGMGQTNPDGTRKLPLRAWYPFDETLSPCYEIACTIQIVTLCCILYTYISFTVFYVVLIIHACGNFKIVILSLTTLRDRVLDKEASAQEVESARGCTRGNARASNEGMGHVRFLTDDACVVGEKPADEHNAAGYAEGDENLHECLSESIKYHQAALRFCKDLIDIYQPVILVQIISSLLIIGQVGFQAIALASQPIGLLKFLSYFGCAVFELLLFCWYSDELSVQECNVAEAAYSCQWYEFPKTAKKMILIAMTRAQRSANETKNSFFNVSCQTCTTILKNSYSIFTLLNQLSDTRE